MSSRIPLIEEHLHIVKQTVETGGVRIQKSTSEKREAFDLPLERE